MFILSRLKSLVRLPPAEWVKPLPEALADAINSKLANTILHEVGLVVAVFDLVEIGESYVFPGDGASHTNVTFRVVVFRPALDEILVGRIKSCTAGEGVAVTLGFFDDIIIPPEALQHPYRFDENEQVWVWEYPTDDGHHDLFMDPGEEIRFRVTGETFVDTSPTNPDAQTEGADREDKRVPFTLHASVNEPGLGLLTWWNS